MTARRMIKVVVCVIGAWMVFTVSGNALAEDKVLRMFHTAPIETFDPARVTNQQTSVFLRAVYDNLVDYKPGSWPDLENELAEKYEYSADLLIYTFSLKKGVKWQKGFGEVTSEDVKFTLERAMDPKTASPTRSVWEPISRIETPDKCTVRIFLKKTAPAFMNKLAPWRSGAIVCKKAVEKFGSEYAQKPETIVGSGPFEVIAFKTGQKYEFKRFEEYHGRKAKVDKIEVFIISDEATAVLSLQKGELNLAHIRTAESVASLRKDPNINVSSGVSGNTSAFIALNTEHPVLKDVRVRQAMAHAVDRDLIVETVGGEMGVKVCGMLAPEVYWGALKCEDLPKYPYDPQKAKRLLAEAGYPNGFKIKYVVITTRPFRDLAPVLQDYWKQVGIEIEIEALPTNDYLKRLNEGSAPALSWIVGPRPPEPSLLLYSALHSSSVKPGINSMLYKGVDDLLEKAMVAKTDAERKALYGQIQKKVIEDCILIPIYVERTILATRKNVDMGQGVRGQNTVCGYWPWFWLEEVDAR
jgi:peptide/nickel transport system substrate-binding protein